MFRSTLLPSASVARSSRQSGLLAGRPPSFANAVAAASRQTRPVCASHPLSAGRGSSGWEPADDDEYLAATGVSGGAPPRGQRGGTGRGRSHDEDALSVAMNEGSRSTTRFDPSNSDGGASIIAMAATAKTPEDIVRAALAAAEVRGAPSSTRSIVKPPVVEDAPPLSPVASALMSGLKPLTLDRRTRLREMNDASARMMAELLDAARARDWQRAIDVLQEAPERGVRVSSRHLELAAEAMLHCPDSRQVMILHKNALSAGIIPTGVLLRRLLQCFARLRFAPGVHALVADIEATGAPVSDAILSSLATAFYAVGLHDRAFQLIDFCRGVPIDRSALPEAETPERAAQRALSISASDTGGYILERLIWQYRKVLTQTLLWERELDPALASMPPVVKREKIYEAKRQFASELQGFYRSIFRYLLNSPAATADEFAIVIEHCAVREVADVLVAMLPHRRVAEALYAHPRLLQLVFASLLEWTCKQHHGFRPVHMPVLHTLEDLAGGTVPSVDSIMGRWHLDHWLYGEKGLGLDAAPAASAAGDAPADGAASSAGTTTAAAAASAAATSPGQAPSAVPAGSATAPPPLPSSVKPSFLRQRALHYSARSRSQDFLADPAYGSISGASIALSHWPADAMLDRGNASLRYIRALSALYLTIESLAQDSAAVAAAVKPAHPVPKLQRSEGAGVDLYAVAVRKAAIAERQRAMAAAADAWNLPPSLIELASGASIAELHPFLRARFFAALVRHGAGTAALQVARDIQRSGVPLDDAQPAWELLKTLSNSFVAVETTFMASQTASAVGARMLASTLDPEMLKALRVYAEMAAGVPSSSVPGSHESAAGTPYAVDPRANKEKEKGAKPAASVHPMLASVVAAQAIAAAGKGILPAASAARAAASPLVSPLLGYVAAWMPGINHFSTAGSWVVPIVDSQPAVAVKNSNHVGANTPREHGPFLRDGTRAPETARDLRPLRHAHTHPARSLAAVYLPPRYLARYAMAIQGLHPTDAKDPWQDGLPEAWSRWRDAADAPRKFTRFGGWTAGGHVRLDVLREQPIEGLPIPGWLTAAASSRGPAGIAELSAASQAAEAAAGSIGDGSAPVYPSVNPLRAVTLKALYGPSDAEELSAFGWTTDRKMKAAMATVQGWSRLVTVAALRHRARIAAEAAAAEHAAAHGADAESIAGMYADASGNVTDDAALAAGLSDGSVSDGAIAVAGASTGSGSDGEWSSTSTSTGSGSGGEGAHDSAAAEAQRSSRAAAAADGAFQQWLQSALADGSLLPSQVTAAASQHAEQMRSHFGEAVALRPLPEQVLALIQADAAATPDRVPAPASGDGVGAGVVPSAVPRTARKVSTGPAVDAARAARRRVIVSDADQQVDDDDDVEGSSEVAVGRGARRRAAYGSGSAGAGDSGAMPGAVGPADADGDAAAEGEGEAADGSAFASYADAAVVAGEAAAAEATARKKAAAALAKAAAGDLSVDVDADGSESAAGAYAADDAAAGPGAGAYAVDGADAVGTDEGGDDGAGTGTGRGTDDVAAMIRAAAFRDEFTVKQTKQSKHARLLDESAAGSRGKPGRTGRGRSKDEDDDELLGLGASGAAGSANRHGPGGDEDHHDDEMSAALSSSASAPYGSRPYGSGGAVSGAYGSRRAASGPGSGSGSAPYGASRSPSGGYGSGSFSTSQSRPSGRRAGSNEETGEWWAKGPAGGGGSADGADGRRPSSPRGTSAAYGGGSGSGKARFSTLADAAAVKTAAFAFVAKQDAPTESTEDSTGGGSDPSAGLR